MLLTNPTFKNDRPEPIPSTFGGGHGVMACKNPPVTAMFVASLCQTAWKWMPPKWPSNPSERSKSSLCQVDQFFCSDEENQEVNLRERKKNCELLRLSSILNKYINCELNDNII